MKLIHLINDVRFKMFLFVVAVLGALLVFAGSALYLIIRKAVHDEMNIFFDYFESTNGKSVRRKE